MTRQQSEAANIHMRSRFDTRGREWTASSSLGVGLIYSRVDFLAKESVAAFLLKHPAGTPGGTNLRRSR
jgi:hypothetical protein